MKIKDRVIIEISDSASSSKYEDAKVLIKLLNQNYRFELFCTNGVSCQSSLSDYDYNFVFIYESSTNLCETIEKIFLDPQNKSKEICIAVHMTGGKITDIKNKITELKLKKILDNISIAKNIEPKEFIHEPRCDLWEKGLLPLIKSINNSYENYSQFFENLWKLLAPSATEVACSLRSKILTPFVALHLALQDSFDENWKVKDNPLIFGGECNKCCDYIEKQILPDQFKGAKSMHDMLKKEFASLCQIIKKNKIEDESKFNEICKELCTAGKSGNGLIGDFANELEDIVQAIQTSQR